MRHQGVGDWFFARHQEGRLCKVTKQLSALLRTDSLGDAAAVKEDLKFLVEDAGRPETNKVYRTICGWWNEIEGLIVSGATTGKVEATLFGAIWRLLLTLLMEGGALMGDTCGWAPGSKPTICAGQRRCW